MNHLIDQLAAGDPNPGAGTRHLFKDVYELRCKNRARVYFRKENGKVQILVKSVKSNQNQIIKILKELYG